ncbi:hypothetical protein CLOSTMETH_01539 [[Clostridium] methylpentosum DSM 5476]|uniref:Uncharacterized protein n=1 Tax=[Clostridium] methylpentosum DSM 5476 TaxID=537013 RepID=C0ECG8_9FIRM|nr:hypothetical protein CLOSTMETH_01539 [[Clostridium] methylpentosum DSM 5476]
MVSIQFLRFISIISLYHVRGAASIAGRMSSRRNKSELFLVFYLKSPCQID